MSLQDAAEMAQDDRLRGPVQAAIITAALNIINEDPTVEDHQHRYYLAQRVLREPQGYVDRFCWAVSTNSTIRGKWSDDDIDGALGDLQYVVDSVWDAFADIPAVVPAPDDQSA